ncbi:site-specific integrase [Paraburkholderia sp. D1E]|uniref:site-specific integrase n=1 Tax=Paraburkholderia sp. D1E TaxID=3461398 RepID=UPI004045C01D
MGEARRITLPSLSLSLATETPERGSEQVTVNGKTETVTYYRNPVRLPGEKRRDGGPNWSLGIYPRFPIVLNSDGSPWAEANVYLIEQAELSTEPNTLSLGTKAEDLAAFRRFCEEDDLDWLSFGPRKFNRPTYLYSAELKHLIRKKKIAVSMAKRRMATVIRFYNWLIASKVLVAENPPWVESGVAVVFKDDFGADRSKTVTTTDVSIKVPKAKDPWEELIDDGGKLRPLPMTEQRAILESLTDLGNTEITLIHLLALLTGGREQTVLTFRVKHVKTPPHEINGNEVRILCGPGTGIDTKKNKAGTLHVPMYLYERLHVYVNSPRAQARRIKNGLDDDEQYLFLTQHGLPFYESIEDRHKLRLKGLQKRGTKLGQSLRGYIRRQVIPLVRKKLNRPRYSYRFHDLRASFGMNFVDFNSARIKAGGEGRNFLMKQLAGLMWHSSVDTTNKYLDYRQILQMAEAADSGWSEYLQKLAEGTVGGRV